MLIVGISGVTCGGKTTLATQLNQFLPKSKIISQDDYFLDVDDPRHINIPELNHINFDILSSLDMEKMHQDILANLENKSSTDFGNVYIDHTKLDVSMTPSLQILYKQLRKVSVTVLIIEGFSIFNYSPLRNIFQLKYYLTLSKEECFRRRIQREYEPPDCPGYFEKCVWPEHIKQLEEVQTEVEGVKYFEEHAHNALEDVLSDIVRILT